MIRVLIAEDSEPARFLLKEILQSDPEIEIVGEARNGVEAVALTGELNPDVVTMDILMPEMDGFEATQKIMAERPRPIVMVSALENMSEAEAAGRALQLGALTVLRKAPGPLAPDFAERAQGIIDMVKSMSKVAVGDTEPDSAEPATYAAKPSGLPPCEVVAIVASTGGPAALQSVLATVSPEFPAPILVVQHMTPGFMDGLAASLNAVSPLRVKLAEHGEAPMPATVYLAPDNMHLTVTRDRRLSLSSAAAVLGFRPSATLLFGTVATAYREAAACVVLTGQGEDGIHGLRDVKETGGVIIAQDEATSVVPDLPIAATAAGLSDAVIPLGAVSYQLFLLCGGPPSK